MNQLTTIQVSYKADDGLEYTFEINENGTVYWVGDYEKREDLGREGDFPDWVFSLRQRIATKGLKYETLYSE